MSNTYLEKLTADPEQMKLYQEERLIVAVTELICREMKQKRIRRAELAAMLGKSKGRISQYLDGERNLTLRTVADIFTALDLTMKVRAEPLSIQEPKNVVLSCVSQAWDKRKWSVPTDDLSPDLPPTLAG